MPCCNKCGKEIIFVWTVAKKRMPVDPEPIYAVELQGEKGLLLVTPGGRTIRAQKAYKGDANALPCYAPHWMSCKARKEESQARFRERRAQQIIEEMAARRKKPAAAAPGGQEPQREQAEQLKLFG